MFKTASEVGFPEHLLEPDRNDFAPRLGFAYQLTGSGKTVLRGGWGINYWTLPLITLQAPDSSERALQLHPVSGRLSARLGRPFPDSPAVRARRQHPGVQ